MSYANVTINAEFFTQNPFAVRKVVMTPLYSYAIDGSEIVAGDRLIKTTNSSGSVVFSGVVSGAYRLDFIGPNRITPVTILVNNTGNLNAANLVVASVSGTNTSAIAYSQAQSDARFYPLTSNPSHYITTGQTGNFGGGSVANVVYTTGDQTIAGSKTYANIGTFEDLLRISGQIQFIAPFGYNKLLDTGGFTFIDFDNRVLVAGDQTNSADFNNRQLSDGSEGASVQWAVRQLLNFNQDATLNWEDRTLLGGWTLDTASLNLNPTGRIYSTVSPTPSMLFNIGPDNDFAVQGPVTLEDGISFASVNDNNTANQSIEFRATQIKFSVAGPPEKAVLIDAVGNLTTPSKVGIGTDTPTQSLDVSGIVRCSSVIVASGATPSPNLGQLIFTSGHFFGYNGTAWKQLDN